mmetsp:Transcript_19266/g.49365  ORF Transcript_19266/g.49365 Transcript_19266/m.49365 type:complete len:158 (+) Transcript_19266:101-574(+)
MPHTIVPFISIKKAKKDATFSIDEDFRNDSSDRKVNLSVGAYKSEEGKAVILKSVKQAEQKVLEGETNKDYLPMSGLKSFTEGARQVLFSGSVESSKVSYVRILRNCGQSKLSFVLSTFVLIFINSIPSFRLYSYYLRINLKPFRLLRSKPSLAQVH